MTLNITKFSDEVFSLVMKHNDPELGLNYLELKPSLRRFFKKRLTNVGKL